ncbi:MAG: sigma-70 family RNA polymerase sigma factor [Gemmatimonadota bacterium]
MRESAERVAAIRRGDRTAIDAAVRECLPGLLRTAMAAGLTRDRAEDAVQGSLLVFVQRAPEFDGRARVCTWLHGILLRKVWEERRGARRDAQKDDIDDVVERRFDADGTWVRPPRGPEEALARGELRRELASCLETLPERQRVAFTLREVEGFTTAEVCNILDVSANNLGVLLFRARNRLRECLEAKGFEGSADASL